MEKIIISLLIVCTSAFSLTLDDVKRGLNYEAIPVDSLEMKFKTTISSPLVGVQTTSTYSVRKGKNKIYYEIRSPFLNQRAVLSGEKMKVLDLNTNKEVVNDARIDLKKMTEAPTVNPFVEGEWRNPEFFSGDVYKIVSDSSEVYYDAKKKQIVKMVQFTETGSVLTTYEYMGNTKILNSVTMSIMVGTQETKIITTFSRFKNSKDFPDSFFQF